MGLLPIVDKFGILPSEKANLFGKRVKKEENALTVAELAYFNTQSKTAAFLFKYYRVF